MANLANDLRQGRFISAPGVHDPLSALVASEVGFDALYMTGYGVSASLLGKPDAGLVSYREMVDRVRAICAVTRLPVIADGDTGFGGLANVVEAVRGYETAGAAAIQLEDQEYPKRCGHTQNRKVIALAEMVNKLKVAVESRTDPDFLIVARTDARTEHGLDEALRRADAFASAGADVLFVESPESEEEMMKITTTFPDIPLLVNLVAGGRTPVLSESRLEEMGFAIAIHPIYSLGVVTRAMSAAYGHLKNHGEQDAEADPINRLNQIVGFDEVWALDRRFSNENGFTE